MVGQRVAAPSMQLQFAVFKLQFANGQVSAPVCKKIIRTESMFVYYAYPLACKLVELRE
jgi:hypothetical protein